MKFIYSKNDLTVEFEAGSGVYEIIKDGGVIKTSKDVKAIEKFLDDYGKKKKPKHEPRAVLYYKTWSKIHEKCVVTAAATEDRLWTKLESGKRETISRLSLFEDCPENNDKFGIIKKLKDDIEKIQSEIKAVEKTLIPFDASAFIDNEVEKGLLEENQ
jgi:hypothetical protein